MTKNYFSMQWHITDKCDQRCKHCYIYAGKDKEYSPEFDYETLKKIFFNYLDTCNRIRIRILQLQEEIHYYTMMYGNY